MGIPEDIRMFRKERVALSDVAYVLARYVYDATSEINDECLPFAV